MKLQSQVTLNDTEVKLAIATYIEANGVVGATSQADSVVIKRSAANGFTAVLDVIQDTDQLPNEDKVFTEVTTEVTKETLVLSDTDADAEAVDELTTEATDEKVTEALDAAQVTASTSLFR